MMKRGFHISFLLASVISLMTLVSVTSCNAGVKHYKLQVINEYPHDVKSYTQGLFFNGGTFYESAGQYSESSFRTVDLKTGKVLKKLDFAAKYFLEGSVILNDKLYILTWTNKVAFIYDAASLEYLQTYSYPREGWGLTTDGESLIASDGSSRIYFMDEKFKTVRTLNVTMDGRPVRYLNELEWIDGKIWANVYTTDMIVIINPSDGKIESTIDCTGLLPAAKRTARTDVLNGIAFDPGSKKIYLTGKYWPSLYEVKLVPDKK